MNWPRSFGVLSPWLYFNIIIMNYFLLKSIHIHVCHLGSLAVEWFLTHLTEVSSNPVKMAYMYVSVIKFFNEFFCTKIHSHMSSW